MLSKVWKSILTDKLRTDGPAWEGEEGRLIMFSFTREGGREVGER